MSRCLYLIKATINNFRSIEHLELKNIGDITVLIGPNESGKSNILSALTWFGTNRPMSYEDKPVDKDINDNEVIVETFFRIIDKEIFKKRLVFEMNKKLVNICECEDMIDFNGLDITPEYLRIKKHADGSFKGAILDTELKELNKTISDYILEELQSKPIVIFAKILKENLESILSSQNVPKDRIPTEVDKIIQNTSFSSHLSSITTKLDSIKANNASELITKLNAEVKPVLNDIPSSGIAFSVNGKNINLNLRSFFTQVYNQTVEEFNRLLDGGCEELLEKVLVKLRPNFVYLSEEMELKGNIKKSDSWSNTLQEDDGEYAVNARFFRVLDIDLEKFDKMDISHQRVLLENKLIEFSNKLAKLWKQLRLEIRLNITPDEITLTIVEVDEKSGAKIKSTLPEARSRGFRWYLAYLITLEYLKKKENIILLLDDPAVFLHENGQRDFLKTMEDISKNIQIMYSTHLVSLFDEKKLDRVLLVKLNEKNKTTIGKPWSNKLKNVAAPVYHALGFDKLMFENAKKFLFVEGISDKFIFEGLQRIDEELSKWYIHPLFGGDNVGNENEIIEKMQLLKCLNEHIDVVDYKYVLDGDKKSKVSSDGDEELLSRSSFLGNDKQEMEDLIDIDFYLECVMETYKNIFVDNLDKLKKLRNIVENLKKQPPESKITKKLNKEFEENGLGSFSKVDVVITIKRKLEKGEAGRRYFEKILKELENIKNTETK